MLLWLRRLWYWRAYREAAKFLEMLHEANLTSLDWIEGHAATPTPNNVLNVLVRPRGMYALLFMEWINLSVAARRAFVRRYYDGET